MWVWNNKQWNSIWIIITWTHTRQITQNEKIDREERLATHCQIVRRKLLDKELRLEVYLKLVKELASCLDNLKIELILKDENRDVDALANHKYALEVISTNAIPLAFIQWPTTWKQIEEDVVACIKEAQNKMTPIIQCLA